MASVPPKDTTPERAVRRLLHASGLRFRINVKAMPGTPDIVLRRWKTVIFVHGCFWHAHGCALSRSPKRNTDYWDAKFEKNKRRDAMNEAMYFDLGWRVAIVWECDLKDPEMLRQRLVRFIKEAATSDSTRH